MPKLLFTLLSFCLFFTVTHAQVLKSYNGPYEDGTAHYTYYEKDYSRMYEGDFTYIKAIRRGTFTETYKANGKFHENLKQGLWTFTVTQTFKGKSRVEILKGNYEKGLKVGPWTDILTGSGNKIIKKAAVNFQNDRMVRNFSFVYHADEMYVTYSSIDAKGSFDDFGLLSGPVNITYQKGSGPKQEIISKYRYGINYWNLERNLNTGEILNKTDRTSTIDSIVNHSNIAEALKHTGEYGSEVTYLGTTYFAQRYTKFEDILQVFVQYWNSTYNWQFDEGFYKNDPSSMVSHGSKMIKADDPFLKIDRLIYDEILDN